MSKAYKGQQCGKDVLSELVDVTLGSSKGETSTSTKGTLTRDLLGHRVHDAAHVLSPKPYKQLYPFLHVPASHHWPRSCA